MYATNKIEALRPACKRRHIHSRTLLIFCLLITALLCLTAACNTSSAANYYLADPKGADGIAGTADDVDSSDSYPGTSEQPWNTIGKAQSNTAPGDTVLIRPGNYGTVEFTSSNYKGGSSDADYIIYKADPATIDSRPDDWWENPFDPRSLSNRAVFTGLTLNSDAAGEGIYIEFDNIDIIDGIVYAEYSISHLRFKNLTISGTTDDWSLPYGFYFFSGASIGNFHDILIENSYIEKTMGGIHLENDMYGNIVFRNNHIYYVAQSGIRLIGPTNHGEILIEGNHIEKQIKIGAHGSGIEVRVENITIRNNIIHSFGTSAGVMLYGPDAAGGQEVYNNMRFENNLFYDIWMYAICFHRIGENFVFNNNTIIGDYRMGSSGDYKYYEPVRLKGMPGSDFEMYNNIIVGSTNFVGGSSSFSTFNEGNNIYWAVHDGTSWPSTFGTNSIVAKYVDLNYFEGSGNFFVSGADFDSYSYTRSGEDPHGVNLNDAYQLADGSDAIGFADPTHAPATDILGVSRVFPPDAGCYEYISGPPDTTPPLPPTNLIRTAQTENSISLSWTAPGPASDGDLASAYKIYRDGNSVDTVTNTFFQNSGLAAGTSYDYKVYSVDDAGNQSTSAATGTFSTSADTTPPVISSVQTSNVIASQATITWNTDENSNSKVVYGLDASYGNATDRDNNLVTSHSVTLTGLSSSTTYHFRVISADASGNESISQNNTFTTSGVKCSLTVSSTIGGSVTTPGEPGPYLYDQGTDVSIEATEDPNYRFVNWTGTAVNADKVDNPGSTSTKVTMNADYTIQANFVIDETDKTAPIVSNCSPDANSIQASLNTLVTLSITDSGDGVDADSVTIKVNNDTVYSGNTAKYSSAYGECYRTGTKADYTFIYQSNESFDFDQPISVTVNATDLAGNAMAEYSYSFTTEMRSFGENKKVGSDNLNKNRAVTVRDGNGDIWAAWQAGATGSRDIYIGKLAAGAANFSNGIKVKDNSTDQCNPAMAVDSDDKLYVAWQDNRRGNWDIYVSTSSDGINWSTETRVTDSNDNQINPAIVVDSSNNAYIVWEDDRNGNQDIYVATSSNGFVTKTVSQITLDNSNQVEPAIAVDSDNTVYIVWTDTRNSKNDIYGAASNNGPWTNIPVVTTEQSQSSPAIATEAVGSILHLVWVDDTPGDDDIFYAKTSGGLPSSPLTGNSIIDDASSTDQLRPAIAVSGSTGNNLQVFVCWVDERNADDDLYFAELGSGSGTNVFVDDDGTNTNQTEPAINIDGDGHPYLVWTDSRNTNTDIYYAGSTFIESDLLASNNISTSSTVIVGTPLNAINSVDDVSIEVPAGSYPFDIKITISKITNPLAFTLQCLAAYDFGPSSIEFSQPVTVIIPYNFTGSEDVALAYWYNSLTDELSQQGITDLESIEISPTLHALRFKTTHFTPFYVFLVSAGAGAAGGGGGGGGCSISPDSQASAVELLLPYIGLTVTMVVLKLKDKRKRKTRNITKSEC